MRWLTRQLLTWQILALVGMPATEPQSCAFLSAGKIFRGDLIILEIEPRIEPTVVDAAVAVWQSCAQYGAGFPSFVRREQQAAGQVGRSVQIAARKIGPGQRCGSFHGSQIVLYAFARDARGDVVPCGSMAQNLAHELGHVLGLSHAPSTPKCKPRIMATLDSLNADRRQITAEECRAVDRRWQTALETLAEPPPGAG